MDKKKIIRLSVYVGLAVILIVAFIVINKKIDKNRLESFFVTANNGRYNIGFDSFEESGNKIDIKGWIFDIWGQTLNFGSALKVKILLKNENDEKDIIEVDTERYLRPELNDMFSAQIDLKYSGIEGLIKKSKLDMEHGNYEILVFYDPWDGDHGYYGIPSGYRIVNGQLIKPAE